jgi:hypothetical protein
VDHSITQDTQFLKISQQPKKPQFKSLETLTPKNCRRFKYLQWWDNRLKSSRIENTLRVEFEEMRDDLCGCVKRARWSSENKNEKITLIHFTCYLTSYDNTNEKVTFTFILNLT